MSKNLGKIFEQNFRKSISNDYFYYRLKDSSSSWGGNSQIRFTSSNIADGILFDGKQLYLIELKNHKGSSIPLNAIVGNKTKIKQIEDLYNTYHKNLNIWCGFIVFFCDKEKCYSLNIDKFNYFIKHEKRKSIPLEFFEENGVEINITKLKVNYKYDIENWLNNLKK